MPKVVDIVPKDLHVLLDISVKELKKLKMALALAHIDFNSELEGEAEAADYVSNTFCPFIIDLLEEIKNGPRSDGERSKSP